MKKVLFTVLILGSLASLATAQQTVPDAANLGVDSSQQMLQEKSINKFEDPGFWRVSIPLDHGVVTYRRFEGAPADKQPIPEEAEAGITEEDKYALGVKAEFFGRTTTSISIEPSRPLAIPGIAKLISVWVVGRNFNHELSVVVEDNFGNTNILPMGKLNFSGWKKLTVAVPPTLEQRNAHYNSRVGIKIKGFVIRPELTETYGSYYVYLDDLRVVTDVFAEENRDPDDIPDNW